MHIINNTVVGFYKTSVVKYKNHNNEDTPYLFPVSFIVGNSAMQVAITYGSVERNFEVPQNFSYNNYRSKLKTVSVGNHLYSLLVGTDTVSYTDYLEREIQTTLKELIYCLIPELNEMGFPFMRIANNDSISRETIEVEPLYEN